MTSRMDKAREAWGVVPDWLKAIIDACDADGMSQNKVAKRMGYTGGLISQVISNTYPGNTGQVEKRAREVFLNGSVACPALGDIEAEACIQWRKKSKRLESAVPHVVRMFTACRNCPRNNTEGQS